MNRRFPPKTGRFFPRRLLKLVVASLAALSLVTWMTGCATTPTGPRQADQFFEAGSFALAISAYERYLENEPAGDDRERVLYRLAVAKTLSSPSALESSNATTPVEYLETLLAEHPNSPYRHEAHALLSLLQNLTRLRQDIDERTARLEQWIDSASRLRQDLTRLEGEKEGAIDRFDQKLNELRLEMQKRRDEIAAQEQQISRLMRELEQLKKIDTGGS